MNDSFTLSPAHIRALAKRIRTIRRLLSERHTSASLLVTSAPQLLASRDQHFPYRQDSDFFYLTGLPFADCALLLHSGSKPAQLVVRRQSAKERVWDGRLPKLDQLARALGVTVTAVPEPRSVLLEHLKGCHELYYQSAPGTLGAIVAEQLFMLRPHERAQFPRHFAHLNVLLEPMRLRKDSFELAATLDAISITAQAFQELVRFAAPGITERDLAAHFDAAVLKLGGSLAFETIVACGPSAATLHHRPTQRRLRPGELLLIDCGAVAHGYAADVSRTFALGGKPTRVQLDLLAIVAAAKSAAEGTIRDGVAVTKVYEAAAEELVVGLRAYKVLRQRTSVAMKKRLYLPYFPHGIGHSLGLDTHDGPALRAYTDARLVAGTLFTVEPGLYFQKAVGKLPRCGVRIEDDILVTARGARNLTPAVPQLFQP